jgi:hypothetical protein
MLTFVSLILDTGVIPSNNAAFSYFTAAQNGLASALCICLLINGFVGFQLYEDGTTLSVWLLRFCCLVMFIISGAVSLFTFRGWAGLGPENTAGMFVVIYIFSAVFIAVYIIMQTILVVNTLQDRWPLFDIFFGVFFLVIGQVILYVFSSSLCAAASHWVDGLFVSTVCNLLAVMMVYKVIFSQATLTHKLTTSQFWDSITTEDFEFSVGVKPNNWEVKELLPATMDGEDRRTTVYGAETNSEYSNSVYNMPPPKRYSGQGWNY